MRSYKENYSFFNEEIKQFLMNSKNTTLKEKKTILCGIAVNVFPISGAMFGNLKLHREKRFFRFENFICI